MTASESVVAILLMAVLTFATRAVPFLLFDRGEEPPQIILRLSRSLPPAIIAMLVIYCLKDMSFTATIHWLPAILGCLTAAALHIWKGNDLLSIFSATLLYMGLLQVL